MRSTPSSPLGLHRVVDPEGTLPQAASVLDAGPEIWADEVLVHVDPDLVGPDLRVGVQHLGGLGQRAPGRVQDAVQAEG